MQEKEDGHTCKGGSAHDVADVFHKGLLSIKQWRM
jgi:hypothetical protein